jgi:GT2 family glycosyltransferase
MQHHDLVGVAGSTRLAGNAWLYADWTHVHGQIGMPGSGARQTIVTAFQMHGDATEGAQMLDGVMMAARRDLWQAQPFDQDTFDGWHLYDFDFSFSAHRAGRRVAVAHDLLVVHESTGNFGPAWQAYARKFIAKHGIAIYSDVKWFV